MTKTLRTTRRPGCNAQQPAPCARYTAPTLDEMAAIEFMGAHKRPPAKVWLDPYSVRDARSVIYRAGAQSGKRGVIISFSVSHGGETPPHDPANIYVWRYNRRERRRDTLWFGTLDGWRQSKTNNQPTEGIQ